MRLELPTSLHIGLILGGLLLVGMLVTLVGVLVSLEGTRSEIRTTRTGVLQTDARIGRVEGGLEPILHAVRPLTSPASRRGLARKGQSLATAADLVPGLASDARRAADATEYIGQTVDAAHLAPSLSALRSLVPVLQSVPSIPRLLRRQTALNASSLRTQRSTLAAVRESLAIQREILVHVRSIDDKTLGPAPAATPLTR